MDGKYQVIYYQTIAAGKFQKIGGATMSYDPDIYPLYHGYAPGADNTEAYKEGGTNVWRSMLLRGAIFGVAGLLGI
jgi:zona occludens toxin